MIPDILEPKTSALIDDLTPLPDVPHNLIRPHGDIYVELEKHGLLSHEQAYRMRRRFDDYDSAAWLVVAPDGRVFYEGWASEYDNRAAVALDALRQRCGNMDAYGGANPDGALRSALLWPSALLALGGAGELVAMFDTDGDMSIRTYGGPRPHPLMGYVSLKTALVQSTTTNNENRS